MPRVGRVQATDEARSYGRRASLLSIGVGITGLITYLYFAIASHELSRDQYGQVAVLWSAVFIVVSVLQRPVEQLLSRTVSENLAHGVPIGRTVRVAATIQLGVAVAFDVVALALRTRSRTTCWTATRRSTGSASRRSPPMARATSPAASSPAATG